MAFTATPGYSWTNGEVITAVKLNSAATPTIADGGTYGFGNGSAAAPSIQFSADSTTGLFWGGSAGKIGVTFAGTQGATLSATSWALLNAGANMQWSVGQDTTHGLYLQWTYNSDASTGLGTITTFGQTNPLKYQALSHSWDVAAQANCVQMFANGSVLFSAAGATDGLNQLQVQGGFGYDRQVAYQTAVAYASTIVLNFTGGNNTNTIAITGTLTLTTSNLGVGRQMQVIISNSSGSDQNFSSWPSWIYLGNAAPTKIASGKTGILTLYSQSTTDAAVLAAWAVQV